MGTITLNHIAKVEGHARLDLQVEDGKLARCTLGAVEGSRYFEGLLVGRQFYDAAEITSRICGICSSAHGVAAVMAMENALGIEASEQTIVLRELQTIGERIRSHASHLYFLAIPEYHGYGSALDMAGKYPGEVKRALRLVKLGNDMVTLVSGRVLHQVATTIGGFTHFPTKGELDTVRQRLVEAKEDIIRTAELVASLEVPYLSIDAPSFCLSVDDEYATSHGSIVVGDDTFEQKDYATVLEEYHEPHSNANFVVKDGRTYYVGALARLNNNGRLLSDEARELVERSGPVLPSLNPFHNNLAQAVELVHYRERCIGILEALVVRKEPLAPFKVRAGRGIAANEAPRGTLWHEYEVDDAGAIVHGNIITPTAQYLRHMQDSCAAYAQMLLDRDAPKDEIVREMEKLIRTYDPCFSCATHFLTVNWH